MLYDAVVLGLGAVGSSALYHLARRGARVLGIERFGIAHNKGSSHGQSRMIRTAYFEHPNYVPLLHRAYELWDELESAGEQKLLYRTGGLYLGELESELVAGSLLAAREHKLPHELIDPAEVRKRFPAFAPPEDHVGFYEPAAGFLLPEKIIEANVALAKHRGAIVITDRVATWSASEGNTITVHAGTESFQTKQLILSNGAWMAESIRGLASLFTVTRQPLAWFEPQQAEQLRLGSFPVFAISNPAGGLYYGFPIHDDRGFKCAYHFPAERADPDQLDRNIRPGEAEAIAAAVNRCIPGACGRLLRSCMCMYTNSPDGHFILDRHPNHENVILASCCSGHGFKFASVIGEILAQLALDGRTSHPIDFLSLKRFKTDGNARPN